MSIVDIQSQLQENASTMSLSTERTGSKRRPGFWVRSVDRQEQVRKKSEEIQIIIEFYE